MQMRKRLALLLLLVFSVSLVLTQAQAEGNAEQKPEAAAPIEEVFVPELTEEELKAEEEKLAKEAAKRAAEEAARVQEETAKSLGYVVLEEVGVTSLINRDSRLPEDYDPKGLVKMKSYNTSGNLTLRKSTIRIHPEAAAALDAMMAAAKADGVTGFILDNAYRSHGTQTVMFERKLKQNPRYGQDRRIPLSTAIPGASEHEAGLAIDICGKNHRSMNEAFGESVYGRWLAANSHRYGYILRYPKGKEKLTGIVYEPWHYRYVGQELAMKLHDQGWTLEEYYADLEKKAENSRS